MVLFDVLKRLGAGLFGEVYIVEAKDDDHDQYVMKIISCSKGNGFNDEMAKLVSLNHYNVVSFRGGFHVANHYDINYIRIPDGCGILNFPAAFIFMDVCSYSLKDYMDTRNDITDGYNRHKFRHILEGLDYLHDNNIMHGNLKPSNVLLDNDMAKLTDFGITENGRILVCNAPYRAPEVDEKKVSERSDIYSAGVVFVEMYMLRDDFSEWCEYDIPLKNHEIPPLLVSLAINMLNPEPGCRPNISTMLDKI